jgi:hypothetical protein
VLAVKSSGSFHIRDALLLYLGLLAAPDKTEDNDIMFFMRKPKSVKMLQDALDGSKTRILLTLIAVIAWQTGGEANHSTTLEKLMKSQLW